MSETETGEACSSCGTSFKKCTDGIFGEAGRACCGRCAYTDTHQAIKLPAMNANATPEEVIKHIGSIVGPLRNRLNEYGEVPLRHVITRVQEAVEFASSGEFNERQAIRRVIENSDNADGIGTKAQSERLIAELAAAVKEARS